MSDRSSCTLTVNAKDVKRIEEIPGLLGEAEMTLKIDPGADGTNVEMDYSELVGGGVVELQALAEDHKISFVASSDAHHNYGPMMYVGYDGEFWEIERDQEGCDSIMIRADRFTGLPVEGALESSTRFGQAYSKAWAATLSKGSMGFKLAAFGEPSRRTMKLGWWLR
jgi:hypothetical protein